MAEAKTTKKSAKKIPERAKVEDIEKKIIDLAKKGNDPAQIGLLLREKYGLTKTKVLGKKISQILKEKNIEHNDDLAIINKKIEKLEQHYNKNKQDKRAKRELVKFIGLRRKLQRYNKKKNK